MEEGFEVKKGEEFIINGRDCFSVTVNRIGHPEMKMYFEKETNLLYKAEFRGRFLDPHLRFTPNETFVEFYFSDYKKTDGINHWRRQEQWRDGRKYSELTVSDVRFFNENDDQRFYVKGLNQQ
jgi:hypothetical protein